MKLSKHSVSLETSSLEVEIVKILTKRLKERRTTGPVFRPSIQEFDPKYVKFSRRYLDLVTLLTICFYSGYLDPLDIYLRMMIQDYLEEELIFPELHASASSRKVLLLVIDGSLSDMNTNMFFGNCLQKSNVQRVLNKVIFKKIFPTSIRKPIRRRGYKDHGSLRPSDRWFETSDLTFTEEQLQIEQERLDYSNLLASILNCVNSGSSEQKLIHLSKLREECLQWRLTKQEIF